MSAAAGPAGNQSLKKVHKELSNCSQFIIRFINMVYVYIILDVVATTELDKLSNL